jgi:ERCC4-related helicase
MSEIRKKKDMNKMLAVSACAQGLKISHAIELLETQTLSGLIQYMKDLFKQASEGKSKGVKKLVANPLFTKAYTLAITLNKEHPKIDKLQELVEEKLKENPKAKIIIFAQFRETVRKIAETLNKIPEASAEIFVGQAIKKHGKETTGLKQKEQKELVDKFREGKSNILVATSIAEEGLDIPEVSEVIFYEPVPSAIRKIQRAGRTARLAPGSLKILITKKTRDEIYHYASYHKEKRMHRAIHSIKKDFDNKRKSEEQILL